MTTLQPILVDAWYQDGVTPAKVPTLVAAGEPWCGMILQATHGLAANQDGWFSAMWPVVRSAAGARYGKTWWRGAYALLQTLHNSIDQADLLASTIQLAGGWGDGDLWLSVDIEAGPGNPDSHDPDARAIVEAGVRAFADRIAQLLGTRPMLYAGSYTRGLGITSRMGCPLLWFPEWDGAIDWNKVRAMGFDIASTLLWQDVGDGSDSAPPGYPHISPIGPLDLSVMVRDNLPAAQGLEWCRTHARASTPI